MLISVVIPAFNAQKYLAAAITSALNQSGCSIEVIVVNDGSSDKTQEIIDTAIQDHGSSVRCYFHPRNQNRGVSASRKLGVDMSRGDYIAFLDADDLFLPGKLQYQASVLEENHGVVLSHSAAALQHEDTSFLQTITAAKVGFNPFAKTTIYNLLDRPDRLTACRICNSSVLARAAHLRATICSIPQAYQTEDWATACLLAEQGLFHYTPDPLVTYRIHRDSFTESVARNKLQQTYAEIELYASLSVLATNDGLRREACERLHEHAERLRGIYGSSPPPEDFTGKPAQMTDWTARLVHERDLLSTRLQQINSHFAVRILRRLRILTTKPTGD